MDDRKSAAPGPAVQKAKLVSHPLSNSSVKHHWL